MIAAFPMSTTVVLNARALPKNTTVPLFPMIWIDKDDSRAKLTPFSNNGQGDFEISGMDKTVSNSRQHQPGWVRLSPNCAHAFHARRLVLRIDFPIARTRSC